MPISILLADDHPIVRRGLRALIEAQPDLHIVGETGTGLRALDLTRRLKPDVLVVDIGMPGLDGLEVTRRVKKRHPRMRVVILTVHTDPHHVWKAMRNGADAYVVKDANVSELVRAIGEVTAGRRYVTPALCPDGIPDLLRKLEKSGGEDPYDTLTNREREVLHLIAEGNTSAQAAAHLGISPRTVEMHRLNLTRKLSLHSQTEVVHYAMIRGIVAPGVNQGGPRP